MAIREAMGRRSHRSIAPRETALWPACTPSSAIPHLRRRGRTGARCRWNRRSLKHSVKTIPLLAHKEEEYERGRSRCLSQTVVIERRKNEIYLLRHNAKILLFNDNPSQEERNGAE